MWQRISVDERCTDEDTCPSVWIDTDHVTGDVVIVGVHVAPGTVPMGVHESAIRVRRQVIADAGLR